MIVNVALEMKEEQTAATTQLRPRPFPSCAPPSQFERCQQRCQNSAREQEEGHRPGDGRRGRILIPLLAMQPFEFMAAAAAVTMATIKTKAAVAVAAVAAVAAAAAEGSGGSLGAARQQH